MQIMNTPLFTQQYPRGSQSFLGMVKKQVNDALLEDIGTGDVTAVLIAEDKTAIATIISRESAVICGVDWVNACFKQVDASITILWRVDEGEEVIENQTLCEISGPARALLSAERCALNFLQTLSAVATQTKQYVELTQHTQAKILDTRKTIPGLRLAQKYAVTVGGGFNQRIALYDAVLIKENHIASAGSITAAIQTAMELHPNLSIQIEVENLNELQEAISAGATSILLDDFSTKEMKQAVDINKAQALLEASGNVNLSTVKTIAETGVDRISIGGLTKNIQAIDLSMRIK